MSILAHLVISLLLFLLCKYTKIGGIILELDVSIRVWLSYSGMKF